ncbi:hypothetical protein MMC27_006732 [Xylographa pallens]|nr:hypothetical protein [Xylographa pallens]
MNPTYSQSQSTQGFQQLVFQYICSFNGTIGMKKLENMALAQLQWVSAGSLPLSTMRTIVQQAIEEYKQLRRSAPPQRLMAPQPTNYAPPYYQPPFQHATTAYYSQQHQFMPTLPPGLFTSNSAVGGSAPSAVGGSAPSTLQHQQLPAYPPRHSPPTSAVEDSAPSTLQDTPSHPAEHSPPSSVEVGSPSSTHQHDPAPPALTTRTTPTTPTTPDEDPVVPLEPFARMVFLQDSEPIRTPSRRVIPVDGEYHSDMPSHSPFSAIGYDCNNVFVPPLRTFGPVRRPGGRLGSRLVTHPPARVVRPEWTVLVRGLGRHIWEQDAVRKSK